MTYCCYSLRAPQVEAKVYDSPNAGIVVGVSLFVLYWTALLVIFIGHGMENDEAGFKFGWSIGWALYVCYALCRVGVIFSPVKHAPNSDCIFIHLAMRLNNTALCRNVMASS